MAGPAGLTRHASTFGRTNVVEAVSEGLPGAPAEQIDAVVDAFLAPPYVLALAAQPDEPEYAVRTDLVRSRSTDFARFPTPELLDLEHRPLSFAEDGFGAPAHTAPDAGGVAALPTRDRQRVR